MAGGGGGDKAGPATHPRFLKLETLSMAITSHKMLYIIKCLGMV